jgi:hypothetical protein
MLQTGEANIFEHDIIGIRKYLASANMVVQTKKMYNPIYVALVEL